MGIRTAHKYSQCVNFGGAFFIILHVPFTADIKKKWYYTFWILNIDLDSIFKVLYIEFYIKIINNDPSRYQSNIYFHRYLWNKQYLYTELKDVCNCNIYQLSLKFQPVHASFRRKQGRNVISNQKNMKKSISKEPIITLQNTSCLLINWWSLSP
jgi:hypothetical protein